MNTRRRALILHVSMTSGLVIAVVWLWRLGHGPLAGPSPSIDGLRVWIERRDPITLALSLTRLEAVAFAAYLLAVTVVGGVARWRALPRATRLVDRLTPPVLRGLLGGVATLGVMAAPTPTPVPSPTTTQTMVAPTTTSPDDEQATLHLLADATDQVAPESPHETWVVQPGENLWLIAREHLIDERGAPVADELILRYWQRLIELNRDRLANPDDPDLIFIDQVLELPAVDAG